VIAPSSKLAIFTAIRRDSSLLEQLLQQDLVVASDGANASPKAKENGRPDHERDHNCVP
jgi:hypothetical protein